MMAVCLSDDLFRQSIRNKKEHLGFARYGDMRKQLREKLATRLGISNIGKDTVRYSVHQIKERSVRLSFCQYQRLLLLSTANAPRITLMS